MGLTSLSSQVINCFSIHGLRFQLWFPFCRERNKDREVKRIRRRGSFPTLSSFLFPACLHRQWTAYSHIGSRQEAQELTPRPPQNMQGYLSFLLEMNFLIVLQLASKDYSICKIPPFSFYFFLNGHCIIIFHTNKKRLFFMVNQCY